MPKGSEGFDLTPEQVYERNKRFIKYGNHEYNTKLSPKEETEFRAWVKKNNVPFDIGAKVTDYDMRGFWKALQSGDPRAKSAIDPNDKRLHYPDYWKTPYDLTFSAQSQWATPGAPNWRGNQLVMPTGQVVFDDAARKVYPMPSIPSYDDMIQGMMAKRSSAQEMLRSTLKGLR
ncbi:MAG: hypothetical protein KGL39_07605 [Patescibacteria group bacterium]|nr:hypothetical protein [Patescibacteria group bacterium]